MIETDSKTCRETGGYRGILQSTTLIGGASVLNILIGMVRVKFAAILIGPAGVGLLGIYNQIIALIATATGMGIGNSGVRQVAEAVGSNDDERIARTVITLRRTAWLTGALGMLVMIILCVPISRVTFGTSNYAISVALLGVTLLFSAITTGQACLLRGARRIADIARITVISAFGGTLISVPCFYLWGIRGIVISQILSSIAVLATSWWYARRFQTVPLMVSWPESRIEARSLLSLGISFMGAALATSATAYAIQALLVRHFSLADAGIYQAAYNLSGVLVGFVLGAMGADYYPRLTAIAGDHSGVHRMVNEQSQVSVLLALPALAAMMVFAPLIIQFFYSASFAAAVPLLRWCILGILGRVFSWPIGFVMLAQGKGTIYFATEAFACGLHLAAVALFTRIWGLDGAGIAFMALYIFYTGLMLIVMRRLVGETWTRQTLKLILISTTIMLLLIINCRLNSNLIGAWSINICILSMVAYYCLNQLLSKSQLGLHELFARLRG